MKHEDLSLKPSNEGGVMVGLVFLAGILLLLAIGIYFYIRGNIRSNVGFAINHFVRRADKTKYCDFIEEMECVIKSNNLAEKMKRLAEPNRMVMDKWIFGESKVKSTINHFKEKIEGANVSDISGLVEEMKLSAESHKESAKRNRDAGAE